MSDPAGARLPDLDVLVGAWTMTTVQHGRTMSTAPVTIRWDDDRQRTFLRLRADPPTQLVDEWQGLAPRWTEIVIGLDDHTDTFGALAVDARGVCRVYRMTFDADGWALHGRPGPAFHQRFHATISADGRTIEGAWEASPDGETWDLDFDVTYRRAD